MNATLARAIAKHETAIKMHPVTMRYLKNRKAHPEMPALHAWTWAKEQERRHNEEPEGFNLDGNPFDVDGWEITITADPDDDNDYSHLGEFTDSETTTTIKNPEAWDRYGNRNNRYIAYFEPMTSEADHFAYLNGKGGMDRQSAHLKARENVLRDLEAAREYSAVSISVAASREGVEFGHDDLGGVDYENPADAVWDNDMIDNAIADAETNLAKLLNRAMLIMEASK